MLTDFRETVETGLDPRPKFISISSLYLLLQMKLQNKGYEEAHEKPEGF